MINPPRLDMVYTCLYDLFMVKLGMVYCLTNSVPNKVQKLWSSKKFTVQRVRSLSLAKTKEQNIGMVEGEKHEKSTEKHVFVPT